MTQQTRRDVALSNEAKPQLFSMASYKNTLFFVRLVLRFCRENRYLPIKGETNSYRLRTAEWRQEESRESEHPGIHTNILFQKRNIYDLIILIQKD